MRFRYAHRKAIGCARVVLRRDVSRCLLSFLLSRVRALSLKLIARILSLSLSLSLSSFQKGDEDDDDDDDDDENINPRRVVGVLLGSTSNNRLDITSSFAVPFEEDPQDSSIWFLDHAYAEQMYRMHSRIHAKEKVVGWYSTGPKIRENDLDIGELFEKYCADPVLVIVNLSPTADDAPTSDASSTARRAKNDDLVAKLRLGDSVDAGRAVKPTRLERAAARVNRERDAATKAVLAFALGVVSMMPTMTTDAPTPQPVVSGVKRTMVAGTVKSATSDATRRGETAAEAQFTRDVERFVGRMSM